MSQKTLQELHGNIITSDIPVDDFQDSVLEQNINELLAGSKTAQAVLVSVSDQRCLIAREFFTDKLGSNKDGGMNIHNPQAGTSIPVLNPDFPLEFMAAMRVHETRHQWQQEQGLAAESTLVQICDIPGGLKRLLFLEADAKAQEVAGIHEALGSSEAHRIYKQHPAEFISTKDHIALSELYTATHGDANDRKRSVFDRFFVSENSAARVYIPRYLNSIHDELQNIREHGLDPDALSGVRYNPEDLKPLKLLGTGSGEGNYLEGGRDLKSAYYMPLFPQATNFIDFLQNEYASEIKMVQAAMAAPRVDRQQDLPDTMPVANALVRSISPGPR